MRADTQLSFDLFLGPVQFCSVQAGFTLHARLWVSKIWSNSGDVTASLGRLGYRHIL